MHSSFVHCSPSRRPNAQAATVRRMLARSPRRASLGAPDASASSHAWISVRAPMRLRLCIRALLCIDPCTVQNARVHFVKCIGCAATPSPREARGTSRQQDSTSKVVENARPREIPAAFPAPARDFKPSASASARSQEGATFRPLGRTKVWHGADAPRHLPSCQSASNVIYYPNQL